MLRCAFFLLLLVMHAPAPRAQTAADPAELERIEAAIARVEAELVDARSERGEAGAEVHAIHHGRVVFADWFNTSGLLLIIDHGDGYMSLYAHNQELFKTVGEWVTNGEVIAAAGNTGGQRDSGLYFEIRHNGRAEDPVNWCAPR